MVDQGFPSIVADLIGLPEWLPKVIGRTAGLVLLATFVISPTTFKNGMSIFVERETKVVMDRLAPLLDTKVSTPPAGPKPVAWDSKSASHNGRSHR